LFFFAGELFLFRKYMLPKAKKSFSQNFLTNRGVLEKIVEVAEIKKGERVLEIGPGTGVLTKALVQAGAQVIAVELDEDLIPILQEQFGEQICLVQGDILTLFEKNVQEVAFTSVQGTEGILKDQKFKLIANIPYAITSAILEQFFTKAPHPTRMIVMVQREVADRLLAIPPKMSLLSVVCQLYAKGKKVMNVSRGSFQPMPKVDSAVVQFDLYPLLDGEDREAIIQLAKQGFSSKRKQLQKNLSATGKFSSQTVKECLEKLGLDQRVRAENLTIPQWIALKQLLSRT